MPALSFWSYVVLFLVLAGSSAGPPLPATLTLTVAAVAARQGHDSLAILLVVATLASIAGDLVGYALGSLLGTTLGRRAWAVRGWGRHMRGRLTAAIAWIDARGGVGGPLVFVSRWGITPIAPAINLIVGARRYPLHRFVVWDSADEALWVARVALPAYALGKAAGLASLPIALAASVLFGILITFGAGRFWPSSQPRPITEGATCNGTTTDSAASADESIAV